MGRIFADFVIGFSVALLAAVAAIALRYLLPNELLAGEFAWQLGVFLVSVVMGSWVSYRNFEEGDDAIRYALAIVCSLIGFAYALMLRELMLGGAIDDDLAGLAFWIALLIVTVCWNDLVEYWHDRHPVLTSFLVSFVVTFVLGAYPALFWNNFLALPVDAPLLRVDGDTHSSPTLGIFSLLERGDIAVNWMVLLLSSVTAAGAYFAKAKLNAILDYVELTVDEVRVAKRMRLPAGDAIAAKDKLDVLYPKVLHINTWEQPPDWVWDRSTKGIVKIFLSGNLDRERLGKVRDLLFHREHDPKKTLIFIYERGSGPVSPPPPLLAYGTGEEIIPLFENDAFLSYARSLDVSAMRDFVGRRRNELLAISPEGDVLLAANYALTSTSIINALRAMRDFGLRRILLVSDKAPYEYGILSADKIARYIDAE